MSFVACMRLTQNTNPSVETTELSRRWNVHVRRVLDLDEGVQRG